MTEINEDFQPEFKVKLDKDCPSTQAFADELTDGAVYFEFDNMLDILFDIDKPEMERNGLTEQSIHLLSSPENKKSKAIYERHQSKFLEYMTSNPKRGYDEATIVNYFTEVYKKGTYSVGSFWCMFSCIRSYILVKTTVDIKRYALLKKLLKGLTEKHVAKKQTYSRQMKWVS